MRQYDQYYKRAQEALDEANRTKDLYRRKTWLDLARGWLSLIPAAVATPGEQFDDHVKRRGTKQDDSESSH